MRTLSDAAQPGAVANTRVLFLPAAYTGPDDFVEAGFVKAVRERGLPLDLVFADVTLKHVTDRSVLRRVRHELVLPARAEGCGSIWICGISLGGFIALSYAERYPAEVNGLCLLAPYLGNHMITGEIERASGVAGWEPGELGPEEDERRVWRFIKLRAGYPVEMHLGYGREDRFAGSHRMMAEALDPDAVQVVAGGHDWAAWATLWSAFLDRQFRRRKPETTRGPFHHSSAATDG